MPALRQASPVKKRTGKWTGGTGTNATTRASDVRENRRRGHRPRRTFSARPKAGSRREILAGFPPLPTPGPLPYSFPQPL